MADYFQLQKDLAAGRIAAVICVYGSDSYLLSDAIKQVKQKVLHTAVAFNFDEIDVKERGANAVVECAMTLPVMSERRLVLGRRFDECKQLESLRSYLDDPAPQTVLMLIGQTLDARTNFAKALKSKGAIYSCEAPQFPQLLAMAKDYAQKQQVMLAPEVYESLRDAYGLDVAQWFMAIDRFALYLGSPGSIDASVADALMSRTRVESIFALTDAVLTGRLQQALPLCQELLEAKEAPLAMVGLCAKQIRQLLVLREALDQGHAAQEAVKLAGIPFFIGDKFIAAARKTNVTTLCSAHQGLVAADSVLKSSKLSPQLNWFFALWQLLT